MRAARSPVLLLGLVLFLVEPSSAGAELRFELSGGALVPFDGDHRDIYGTTATGTLGVSAPIGERRGRAFLEVGYAEISGFEIPPDPTFESDPSSIRWIPVGVGLRSRMDEATTERTVRVSVGAGWQMVFARWEGPGAPSKSTPTFGGFVEIRPEVVLSSRWMVWVRQRLSFLADARFDGTLADELNYSGNALEVGLAFDFSSKRPHPRRTEP